jgi:hypothetical protein
MQNARARRAADTSIDDRGALQEWWLRRLLPRPNRNPSPPPLLRPSPTCPRTSPIAATRPSGGANGPRPHDFCRRAARPRPDRSRRPYNRARRRAEQRLADAETTLDRLGWRRYRRRGYQLRNEIALQQTALRLTDQKLAQPPRPWSGTRTCDHDPAIAKTSRTRSHELRQARRHLERLPRPSLEHERGLDLEL